MALAFTQLAAATASTTNAASYAGTAGTPVAGNLLICFVMASGKNTQGSLAGTFTWTRLTSFTYNTNADIIEVFWAYAATATSTTPTYTVGTGGNATGCIIYCVRVTGAEGQTQPYIRQIATNTGLAANPSITFGAAALTGNGLLGFASNSTNSATQWTAPTGFTEMSEVAYTTPAKSGQTSQAASGITATTISWTNVNTTAWGVIMLEFYVAGTCANPNDSVAGLSGDNTNI
tara:strand:+ start:1771 stop:2469 length:699 start_codon:yes stop_codon:yes gene_type:complete